LLPERWANNADHTHAQRSGSCYLNRSADLREGFHVRDLSARRVAPVSHHAARLSPGGLAIMIDPQVARILSHSEKF
jgi:hypothetical protein